MAGVRPSVVVAAVGSLLLVISAIQPAGGQEKPPDPFGLTWANLAGPKVFKDKGCGQCHAIRGVGPTAGPELSRIERKGFFDLGAALSNHLRGVNIPRSPLTPEEVNALIAFVFTLQYYDAPGDSKVGERLFRAKGCIQCHRLGGEGGRLGPSLDFLKRANSPVLVAAALWNHGPEMVATIAAKGITRPDFVEHELGDIIAYVQMAAEESGGGARQVVPGTPEHGKKLFRAKRCVVCHSIAGEGGEVGPELGARQRVSLTEFATLMWNHGPKMWAKMRELGIEIPRVTGQEMADIVAYLYSSLYFDQALDPGRGRRVLEDTGCLTCHAIRGPGPTIGADLATYTSVRSSAGLVASLWNHPRYLEARKQEVPWPVLSGGDLADMGAHLSAIAEPGGSSPSSE